MGAPQGLLRRLRNRVGCMLTSMFQGDGGRGAFYPNGAPESGRKDDSAPGVGIPRTGMAYSPFPDGDWRLDVLNDFAGWLAELDDSALPPPPPNLSHGLFDLATEVSALRQELKRQNREQGKSNEELERLNSVYREALSRVQTKGDDLAGLKREVQRDTEKRVFLLFADLRDSLERGLKEVRNTSGKRPFFFKPPPAMKGIEEGYEMAVDRFDRTMMNLGIEMVPTEGRPFDPRTMRAIGTRHVPGVAPGMVVEETMSGYVRDDEVLRLAQVVVSASDQ